MSLRALLFATLLAAAAVCASAGTTSVMLYRHSTLDKVTSRAARNVAVSFVGVGGREGEGGTDWRGANSPRMRASLAGVARGEKRATAAASHAHHTLSAPSMGLPMPTSPIARAGTGRQGEEACPAV
jgi:hypothetical protein